MHQKRYMTVVFTLTKYSNKRCFMTAPFKYVCLLIQPDSFGIMSVLLENEGYRWVHWSIIVKPCATINVSKARGNTEPRLEEEHFTNIQNEKDQNI